MEELDQTSLYDILNKLGRKNPNNFTHITEVGEILITRGKWKNYTTKTGGSGAIELVMHLLNYKRDKACNWLIYEFKDKKPFSLPSPGFYWVKCRPGGRWEVAEFDGVAWLSGPEDDRENHIIGPRIQEPKH